MRQTSLPRILSWIAFGFLVVVSHICHAAEEEGQNKIRPQAQMNVVFLDDAAEGLPAGATVRHNQWPEWDARVPTFQKLLRTFVADFHKARGRQPAAEASLYALEVSAGVKAAERDRQIAEYLAAIAKATKRPTLVLARSTAGADQLRIVFVFENDCPPQEAAGFLAALAEVAPPLFHARIGERFGPFRAPPTVVFDPRADALAAVPAGEKARHRWALLEENAYLLPHYVLHAVAALHEAPLTEEAAWLADRTLEPGAAFDLIASRAEKVQELRARGDFVSKLRADFLGNRLVEQVEGLASMPGGINNVTGLYQRHPSLERIITPEVNRVGLHNLGPGREFADNTEIAGYSLGVGGAIIGGPGAPAAIGIGAGTAWAGGKMGDWAQEHVVFFRN